MKSRHTACYTAMTCLMGLTAIVAGGAALVFAGLGEPRNCLIAMGLLVTLSFLSLCYRELSKPSSWSDNPCAPRLR